MKNCGFLGKKYPFIRDGQSSDYVVIFPPTGSLVTNVKDVRNNLIRQYRMFFPSSQYSLLIIGYDPFLRRDHSSLGIANEFAEILQMKEFDSNFRGVATIVGVSYGGKIAIPFAANFPDLVNKLVLLVSASELSDKGVVFCKECIEIARNIGTQDITLPLKLNELHNNRYLKSVMDKLVKFTWEKGACKRNPSDLIIAAYEYLLENNNESESYLPEIAAETLVLGADKDLLFTQKVYERTADLIPNGKSVIIPDTGHLAPIEKFFKCRKEIREFIK